MKKKTARAATLADVGSEAGVSAMAASAVLNNANTSSRIAESTRRRILEAAARLNYRRNAAARALAARRMHAIGVAAVIEAGELNHYFLEVLNGVLEAAARLEQNTTVFALKDWQKDAEKRLPGFCDGRIDGLILIAPTLSQATAKRLPEDNPFVFIHGNIHLSGIPNLESDEERGARELVAHLIALGHRRILHLAGPRGRIGAERRIRGYRAALETAGLQPDGDLLIQADYTQSGGRAAMRRWLEQHGRHALPDAIFCCNDSAAAGCLEVLAEARIRVPDDVSLAGFDDNLVARTTVPQLTTVRQPLREMGATAVETLVRFREAMHRGEDPAEEAPPIFATCLVHRASVAPRQS